MRKEDLMTEPERKATEYARKVLEDMGNPFSEYGEYRQKTLVTFDTYDLEEAFIAGYKAAKTESV